jgi:hypothetical protein
VRLSLADPVAIVSIVSGATVAIAVPFISATLERRRLRWQSETERLNELRRLLDTASVHMYGAWTVVYEIEQEMQTDIASARWSRERHQEQAAALTARFDDVMRDQLRVALRLPKGSAVTAKHQAMVNLLMKAEYEYRRYVEHGQLEERPSSLPSSAEGSQALGEFMDEVRTVVGATSEARHDQRRS